MGRQHILECPQCFLSKFTFPLSNTIISYALPSQKTSYPPLPFLFSLDDLDSYFMRKSTLLAWNAFISSPPYVKPACFDTCFSILPHITMESMCLCPQRCIFHLDSSSHHINLFVCVAVGCYFFFLLVCVGG